MGGIGGPELFLVLVVVLLVFGPRKIPEFARGLGKGLREFRKLSTEFQREINLTAALEEEERKAVNRPATPAATPAVSPDTPAGAPGIAEPPAESDDSRGGTG